jgi:hypothetical protein
MVNVCGRLTPEQAAYAVNHHLCGSTASQPGLQIPRNTVGGNCGTSTLYIFNQNAGRWAIFYEAAQSTVGPMTFVHTNVAWDNLTKGINGNFTTNQALFSSSWSRTDREFTWTGIVTTGMNGWAAAGPYICAIGVPTDAAYIT